MQISNSLYIDHNFFLIDSDNCSSIEPRLYGFGLNSNHIFNTYCENRLLPWDTAGVWLNLARRGDNLYIQQDFWGSYGLYLYRNGDYFALSNSSYYLLKALARRFPLKINKDYIASVMAGTYSTHGYRNSYIHDMISLDPRETVEINCAAKKMRIVYQDRPYNRARLDSSEGVAAIEKWKARYKSLFHALRKNNCSVHLTLSGGMDSRTAYAGFLATDDFPARGTISTIGGSAHTYADDYRIAQEICRRLDLPFNAYERAAPAKYKVSPYGALLYSWLPNFLYHKKFFYTADFYKEPLFRFSGGGGEGLRNYFPMPLAEYMAMICCLPDFRNAPINARARAFIEREMELFNKRPIPGVKLVQAYYNYTTLRHHFIKTQIMDLLHNAYVITPLFDPLLHTLEYGNDGISRDIIYAVIQQRYVPQLADLGFDSGRAFGKDLLEEARRINANYDNNEEINPDYQIDIRPIVAPVPYEGPEFDWDAWLAGEFRSTEFRDFVIKTCGEDVYEYALNYSAGSYSDKQSVTLYQYYLLTLIIADRTDLYPPFSGLTP